MPPLWIICVILLGLFFLMVMIKPKIDAKRKGPYAPYQYKFSGKLNDKLLTDTELHFYTALKQITDAYHLTICIKVRLADIIQTKTQRNFKKVSAKHMDFTICKPDTTPLLFIELDLREENHQRDMKKDAIFASLGIKILRIKPKEEKQGLLYIQNLLQKRALKNA